MSFPLLATWVHHWDPFAIQFSETFGIRWYGLAYVAGFLVGFLIIRWFVKIGVSELKENQVADFITIVALFGTMLGGRLGYMLFYNLDGFLENPISFFDFLGGGMSSHGGIFGITLAALAYARYHKISWLSLGDSLVVVAPIGVFFGRLANFVNGELFGRVTSHPWAMKFPEELRERTVTEQGEQWLIPTSQLVDLTKRGAEVAPGLAEQADSILAQQPNPHWSLTNLIIETSRENEAFRAMLGEILNPRHPSQLYEALIEGLIPATLLFILRVKFKNLYQGVITGIFFLVYAVGRILVENVREPDSSFIMGVTRGQFYSFFMIAAGIGFLAYAIKKKGQNRIAGPDPRDS